MGKFHATSHKIIANKSGRLLIRTAKRLYYPNICINPLSPDIAIWHNMQLHAQYSVNLHAICTTKRSWEDLHFEGIILGPPPIQDLIYHPCNFWNLLSCTFYTKLIADNKLCTESCKLSYS